MPIRTALVSVSDKTGLIALRVARSPSAASTILSSGGTAKALAAEGIPVETVESYTGSPEVMDGRVKTLHPRVHGGILARAGTDDQDLARIGGKLIDLVVVNLYPFEKVAENPTAALRRDRSRTSTSAARRWCARRRRTTRASPSCATRATTTGCSPRSRARARSRATTRRGLAAKAFAHTAAYDAAISGVPLRPARSGCRRHGGREPVSAVPHAALRARVRPSLRREPAPAGAFYVERNAPAGHARAGGEPRAPAARSCRSTTSSTSTPRSRRCASSTAPGRGRREAHEPVRRRRRRRARRRLPDARARPTRSARSAASSR